MQIKTIALLLFSSLALQAETTIDGDYHNAYSANTGWIDAVYGTKKSGGAVIGRTYCTGYIYSANCGWISLGNGPQNGYHYSNTSATDWGVNHDELGNLSGYAYGANIGWINFNVSQGGPKIDMGAGQLYGSVWSANTGWISLDTTESSLVTEFLSSGPDSDSDGIPDYWEYSTMGNLNFLHGAGNDADGDGATDYEEYLMDTAPEKSTSLLSLSLDEINGTDHLLSWVSRSTRHYRLYTSTNLLNSWSSTASGRMIGSNYVHDIQPITSAPRFYKIEATLPLSN